MVTNRKMRVSQIYLVKKESQNFLPLCLKLKGIVQNLQFWVNFPY